MCTAWRPCATLTAAARQMLPVGGGGSSAGLAHRAWPLAQLLLASLPPAHAPLTPSARSGSSRWWAATVRSSRSAACSCTLWASVYLMPLMCQRLCLCLALPLHHMTLRKIINSLALQSGRKPSISSVRTTAMWCLHPLCALFLMYSPIILQYACHEWGIFIAFNRCMQSCLKQLQTCLG